MQAINENTKNTVEEVIRMTGLEFTKSVNTNSYYNHLLDIRISDHHSKFAERKGAHSHDFVNWKAADIVKSLSKDSWFAQLKEGVKIAHQNEKVGALEYISHDNTRETVTVLRLSDNKIISYWFQKIDIL